MGYWFSEASLTAHIQVYRRSKVFVFQPGRRLQQSVAASARGNKAATSAAWFRSLQGGRKVTNNDPVYGEFPLYTDGWKKRRKPSWNLRLWLVGGNAAVLFVVYRLVCLAADWFFLLKWQRNKIDQMCWFAAPVTRSLCRKHSGGLQCQSMKSI